MKVLRLLIFLFIAINSSTIFAQNNGELEKQYNNFDVQLSREYSILDSLNNLLNQKAKQIDNEKGKNNPDKDAIVKLMSSSATISNNINRHQENVKELEKNSRYVRKELSKRYDSIIDSLKNYKDSNSGDSREIDSKILIYTEKKIIMEPGIQDLSYKPDKILNFRISNPSDKKEVSAYSEYLKNALSEVASVIDGITEKNSELKDVIALQKKTQKFLKEIEMESRPGSPSYSVRSSTTQSSGTKLTDGVGVSNEAYYGQVHAYTLLLDQLSFDKSINTNLKWEYKFDKDKFIDLNDYNELLKEVKKNLVEYKNILKNKLDSLK